MAKQTQNGKVIRLQQKKKKRRKNVSFLAVCFTIVLLGAVAAFRQLGDISKQKLEMQKYDQQIENMTAANQELQRQLDYMETDEYIKSVARDQLGLLRPNEIRFIEDTSK